MDDLAKILTETPAKDVNNATSSLNQFEENIRAYEERGVRYKLEAVLKIARWQMLIPTKIQEFEARRTTRRASAVNFTKGSAPMLDNLQAEKPVTKPKKWNWWPAEWPEPGGELAFWGQGWALDRSPVWTIDRSRP